MLLAVKGLCLRALGGGALLNGGEDGVAVLLVAGDGAGEAGVHAGHDCGVGDLLGGWVGYGWKRRKA